MCGSSSPPPPPPPPDYTNQINSAKDDMRAYNTKLANEYNQSVSDWNTDIGGYDPTKSRGNINPYAAAFGGSSGVDQGVMDSFLGGSDGFQMEDLNSSAQKDALRNQISGARSGMDYLDSLNFDTDIPEFRTHTSGDGWSTSVYDTPTLNRPNQSMVNNYRRKYSDALSQLENVNKQRGAEEKRITDFRSGLMNNLSEADVGLGQMTIADLSDMDRLDRDLARGQNKVDQFTSTILDQMYPEGFTEVSSRQSGLSDRLGTLRGERTAEENRISDFESGILNFVDKGLTDFGTYDITNLPELEAMRDSIEEQNRGIGRFSSLLGTDFLDEQSELSGLGGDVQDMLAERAAEERRIKRDAGAFGDTAEYLRDAALGGNPYSQKSLDAMATGISDLRGDMDSYESLLDTDFTGTAGALGEADTALKGFLDQRKTAIDDLESRATGANVGLEDIALHDEDALKKMISDNRGITGDLSAYTGGRVGGIQDVIGGNVTAVEEKIGKLGEMRSDLEVQAQTLRDKLKDATFRSSGDFADPQSEYDTLKTQIDLYNAQQAMDELAEMMDRLTTERSRVSTDEAQAAAREKAAQDRINNSMRGGVPQFGASGASGQLTAEQYMALLQSGGKEEEEVTTSGGNPFSLNFGAA